MSDNTGWDRVIAISLSTGEVAEVSPIRMEEADVIKACELLDIDRNTKEAMEFIRALEGAIAIFKIDRTKARPETESEIKTAFTQLKEAEVKAKQFFECLSPTKQHRLDLMLRFLDKTNNQAPEAREPGIKTVNTRPSTFPSLEERTIFLRNCLIEAVDLLIASIPLGSGGAPMNIPERLLIIAVAEAYEHATGEKPTTTEEGPFELLLRLALRIGGDEKVEDKSLHSLIRRTLKGSKPHPKS